MTLTIGSMFSGYGGLDLAVEAAFNATTSWHCEWEDAPSKVLAARWPGVPNYRDVTAVDWTAVPPVDIITGGFPCQDVSLAGRRAGMTEGTRSNLWGAMRTAIETIQPRYVVAENVRGLLSAKAESDSDMEPGPGSLGDDGRPNLRALGRVLGDLADCGYDAQWRGLRAADVGAPHGRFRVFILATRRDVATDPSGLGRAEAIEHHGRGTQAEHGTTVPDQSDRQPVWTGPNGGRAATADTMCSGDCGWASEPEPTGGDHAPIGSGPRGSRAGEVAAYPGGEVGEQRAGLRQGWPAGVGRGRPDHHCSPLIADADGHESERVGGHRGVGCTTSSRESNQGEREWLWDATGDCRPEDRGIRWGQYAPAIRRWERLHGRAPAPTELTAKGKHRLSAKFAEWMMGLPAGWVTGIDISRNEQLKALGNGVVPHQAHAALVHMLGA